MDVLAAGEISPQVALQRQRRGALLIDVREEHERAVGMAKDAVAIALGDIATGIATIEPDRQRELVMLCGSGRRSMLARDALLEIGYGNVHSVAGGFEGWQREGLPLAAFALDADAMERYSRHLLLPEVGVAGQKHL
ncbi:MAG: rhodanese-like domain-containing protein, partial [Dokdonella sp.]